ncbi:MAG: TetR/AcrR family transcriptional regulator [Desulfobacterales bacterium]|nr:TetR/AcrR family transcriptional regulator [Pseudomonadota bacterium]MBU4354304.1 TetR/AcrR family transcriptional regulator [Pseudomonadota bacterium]MCG2770909.1 TetR/AcrR family transcriptional regulator [Desulfobacterales bacterium]
MEDKKLPRREREKLRQRQEMLATALDLFSQKGYHNVSMHEVAEQAEFAIGTIYKFFQNKEDLYRALVLEQCDKFEDALIQAIETPDDEIEKLRNYVRTRSERFRSNLPFVRLFLAESRGVSFNIKAGLNEELRKRYYNFLERLASVFDRGIKNKRFKKIADPYYLAAALDSVIDASLLLWLDAPERHPYPEDPDTILDIFFRGLIDP